MYNGIGLATARGSGTNGYVQKNLAFIKMGKTKIEVEVSSFAAIISFPKELQVKILFFKINLKFLAEKVQFSKM